MSEKLDEFKAFVRRHPLLRSEVEAKRKTWQELYEEYVILGESSDLFKKYEQNTDSNTATKETETKKTGDTKTSTEDMIKTVVNYVKKIDPDQITKTVTSIQKVIELISSFTGGAAVATAAKKSTGDPLFDKKFDEWY